MFTLDRIREEASGRKTLYHGLVPESDRLAIKKELYNQYAVQYRQRTDAAITLYRQDYDMFAALVGCGSRVLDLGCGPGRDGLELRQRGLYILGVDFAYRALSIAESRGLETRLLDYETDLSTLGIFDALWTNCSLTTTPQEQIVKVLHELGGHLKENATAFFGFIEGEEHNEGWMLPDHKYNLPRYRFRDTQQGITALLGAGGFAAHYIHKIPKEVSGKNTYLNFFCTSVPRL